ncbi:ABC-2 type transport system ATP-binding protein [Desulfobotulus alkaliphilus]|uniref:ABC-2 type transport system ATP-binding protein n=1 Tax=Desulfobotulus alkaliphilus TaxID=622671 RepID=A0A562S8Z1_9BACT|nr:ABC transporter ATP-binding protein [Desulfobotulus alkaliphilus]TWI77204.1 ABC-2 type transport system ATP-binding protein [Desulfobotulus alkaliphilus]
MTQPHPVIQIKNLFKKLRSQEKFLIRHERTILSNITLAVSRGKVLGIIGLNGAGKTTLVKHILGLTRQSSGTVSIAGIPADQPEARKHLGYLPENPYYYDHLTPEELLSFGLCHQFLSRSEKKERIVSCLRAVGMAHAARKRLRTFSKGMVQRTGLALAMVSDPDILILDEPMSGLDPFGRKMVADLMLDLKQKGKTILFCSHILNDVERMADRIVILHQGRIAKEIRKEEMAGLSGELRVLVSGKLPPSEGASIEALQNGHSLVRCLPETLPDLLHLCRREGLEVLEIKSPESSLEAVFSQVIASTSTYACAEMAG